jgi:phosphatidylinositol-3-phosphatase
MRPAFVVVALIASATLVAGWGGSHDPSPSPSRQAGPAAERAAIAAAQRQNDRLRIFPGEQRTIRCRIPTAGRRASSPGRCTTEVWAHGTETQVAFVQRARTHGRLRTGSWVYELGGGNQVLSFHPRGWLPQQAPIPPYRHIVEIMLENASYGTIIGNPDAPNINALVGKYGLATDYFGVTHPSEPNYVAAIGGDFFGIRADDQFYCTPALAKSDPNCADTTVDHTVKARSIADQLTAAGMTWKGYFQSLPPTPSTFIKTGPRANGPYTFEYPGTGAALYASKHNPFLNFVGTQDAVANMVPDTQLGTDLENGALPNFSLVVPDQCHDMHGTLGCIVTPHGRSAVGKRSIGLVSAGDTYVGHIVKEVMASRQWQQGRNAIVITWDEDDYSDEGRQGSGCCGFDPGGGHVAAVVITNKTWHYPVRAATPYNHYSLLRSLEDAFGLPCLAHACDPAIRPLTPLFQP